MLEKNLILQNNFLLYIYGKLEILGVSEIKLRMWQGLKCMTSLVVTEILKCMNNVFLNWAAMVSIQTQLSVVNKFQGLKQVP